MLRFVPAENVEEVSEGGHSTLSDIVDATYATPGAAQLFHSFFTAKSLHEVDAAMNHFSKTTLTHIDAMDSGALLRRTKPM